jgi:hypothetical protein
MKMNPPNILTSTSSHTQIKHTLIILSIIILSNYIKLYVTRHLDTKKSYTHCTYISCLEKRKLLLIRNFKEIGSTNSYHENNFPNYSCHISFMIDMHTIVFLYLYTFKTLNTLIFHCPSCFGQLLCDRKKLFINVEKHFRFPFIKYTHVSQK